MKIFKSKGYLLVIAIFLLTSSLVPGVVATGFNTGYGNGYPPIRTDTSQLLGSGNRQLQCCAQWPTNDSLHGWHTDDCIEMMWGIVFFPLLSNSRVLLSLWHLLCTDDWLDRDSGVLDSALTGSGKPVVSTSAQLCVRWCAASYTVAWTWSSRECLRDSKRDRSAPPPPGVVVRYSTALRWRLSGIFFSPPLLTLLLIYIKFIISF